MTLQLMVDLLTQVLVIAIVGAGRSTDAYIAAQAVPAVVGAVLAAALQGVWLRRLSVHAGDETSWQRELSTAQGQALLLAGGLLLLLGLSEQVWMPLLFPGLDAAQHADVFAYSPALFLASALQAHSGLHTAALRARGRFIVPEWIAAAATVLALAALPFALTRWGVQAAAWIGLGRAVVVYLVLARTCGWPTPSVKLGWYCQDTWRLMRPLLFGTSVYKTTPLVDRYWASQAGAGGITTLSLAQAIVGALTAVLERVFFMPAMPGLARLAAERRFADLRRACLRMLGTGGLLLAALLLAAGVGREPAIALLSWAFSLRADNAAQIWLLAVLLLGHLYSGITGPALVSVYYALGDSRTPVIIGVAGFVLGLVLKWVLFNQTGLAGLAIASSTYFLLNILFFFLGLQRKMCRP